MTIRNNIHMPVNFRDLAENKRMFNMVKSKEI